MRSSTPIFRSVRCGGRCLRHFSRPAHLQVSRSLLAAISSSALGAAMKCSLRSFRRTVRIRLSCSSETAAPPPASVPKSQSSTSTPNLATPQAMSSLLIPATVLLRLGRVVVQSLRCNGAPLTIWSSHITGPHGSSKPGRTPMVSRSAMSRSPNRPAPNPSLHPTCYSGRSPL